MSGAGETLQAAFAAALRGIEGLGVYDGPPVQAAFPYAVADAGLETDWSHKSGVGREVRIAVTLRDRGERPLRLRRLISEAETALDVLAGTYDGWRLVSLFYLRSRLVPETRGSGPASQPGWAGVIEFRARMLREEPG
jgi:hypothetical protein